MDYYELVRGPFAVFSFVVLILGTLYRLLGMVLIGKKNKMLYPRKSFIGGVRSIAHHLIPFGAIYMRNSPIFAAITVMFHVSMIVLPVFLLAHIILWCESYDVLWWNIPDGVADILTCMVLVGCLFFAGRRILVKEIRQVSTASDFLLLVVIFVSCVTGFLASHQWGPYRPMLIVHILSGEILLMLIPFSRLMHMIFFLFSRAYMGAEYGTVLGSEDW